MWVRDEDDSARESGRDVKDVKVLPVKQPEQECKQRQCIVVMRHGKRHDSDNPRWNHSAAHPWDTPLSKRGMKELETVGPKLEALQPQLVIISPFLRCMQTAHRVISSWTKRPPNLHIVVDKQLSEVFHPTLLYPGRDPSCFTVLRRWWWQWHCKQRVLQQLSQLGCPLEVANNRWPQYPEDKRHAHARFKHAIDYWAGTCTGNILFISHGDAVLSGIKRVQPYLDVSNVQPGGYMVMARSLEPSVGTWQLEDQLLPWHGVDLCLPQQHTSEVLMFGP